MIVAAEPACLTRLVRLYFPPEEWENAACVVRAESGGRPDAMKDEGIVDCGNGAMQGNSHGLFQILDVCWNPALNPRSPFSVEHWERVLEPNTNVWMASVIWSRAGWRAWTTCQGCGLCEVPGTPIPHPRSSQVDPCEEPPPPGCTGPDCPPIVLEAPLVPGALFLVGMMALVSGIALWWQGVRGV